MTLDVNRREAVDELTDLGQKGLDICMKEDHDGTLDEKYYSDRLVEQTILLIGENMCIVDGEHDVKEALVTLKDLLDWVSANGTAVVIEKIEWRKDK